MRTVSSDVLEDPAYGMPAVSPASDGVGWLRASVVRFADGEVHRRRRALVVDRLARLDVVPDGRSPTSALLAALELPAELVDDVALVAVSYQPHAPQSVAADRAADRLVAACGGRTEEAAAVAAIVVQAHAATEAMIDVQRAGSTAPPVPFTRRVAPAGHEVLVDLGDAPFGRGPHRCPGEQLARRLVNAALT